MRRTRSQSKAISNLSPHDSQSPANTSISSNPPPPPPPSSSKILFRARKIPRVTSDSVKNKDEASTLSQDKAISTQKQVPSVQPVIMKPLTSKGELDLALVHLRKADSLLATCIDSFRPPDLVTHHQPFSSLTRSIICQQLSNKAAKTIHDRFVSLCGGEASVLPDAVLGLSAQQLRGAGISGPKASYLHDLASKYRDGVLSDSSILEMDDETLYTKLTMVKGIGPWSVHMFMIFTLHRPDVLPVGDLVVRRGVERLYGLKALPPPSQVEKLCEKWKPYRSVGAWYMYRLMEAKGVLPTAAAADGTMTEHQQMQ